MPCITDDYSDGYTSEARAKVKKLTEILCAIMKWRQHMKVNVHSMPTLYAQWEVMHLKADAARIAKMKKHKEESIARLKKQQADIVQELKELTE